MEELANEVSGATTSLIDQVLREYGDPGENDGEKNIKQDNSSEDREEELLMSESEVSVDSAVESEQLTDKELATLRVLRENPNATQAELVEDLGVSRATISQRVNAIDGFDWSQQHELINPMIENGEKTTTDSESASNPIDGLSARIDALEQKTDSIESENRIGGSSPSALSDPELAHKVVHACLSSENISEEEELMILKDLMTGTDTE